MASDSFFRYNPHSMKHLQFYRAIAVLVGGVVGAGIFGVPYVFAKAGWGIALFYLILLSLVNIMLNLGYGEVILRTGRTHQLVGFAGIYLGSIYKKIALFATTLSIYAALLAYIILGGQFLFNLTAFYSQWTVELTSWLFFIAGSLLIWRGLKAIAKVDFWMMLFYLGVTAALVIWGAPHLQRENFILWDKVHWFLPYGVIWFALSGMSSVVLQREVLEGQENKLKRAIIWGSLIPPLVYLLFALVVIGVVGLVPAESVFSALAVKLGQPILILGSLFGLFAVFTSFINLGRVLLEAFQFDFRMRKPAAWTITILPPALLFLAGVRNFIGVIGFAGAVALGVNAIIFILIYRKVKHAGHRIPEYSLNLPGWLWYVVLLFSLCGVGYEILGKFVQSNV